MGNTKRALEPSRAERKAKKRKLEDAIPDVPTDFDIQEHDSLTSKTARSTTKKGKINEGTSHPNLTMQIEGGQHEARKEAKKENKKKVITATDSHGADLPSVEKTTKNTISPTTRELVERATETSDIPKKSKKERKAERKAREAADVANRDKGNLVDSPHLRPEPNEHSTPSRSEHKKPAKNNRNREKKRKGINVENATAPGNGGVSNAKAARFIVFIGKSNFQNKNDLLVAESAAQGVCLTPQQQSLFKSILQL
jgi:nucleolar protein 6